MYDASYVFYLTQKIFIMKKGLIIALCITSLSLFAMKDANAFLNIQINVEIETGRRQWNADHTETHCVGRGLCRLKLGGGTSTAAIMVVTDNGNLGFAIRESDIDKRQFSNLRDDNGNVYVSVTERFDDDLIARLQKAGINVDHINAGTYKPIIQDGYVVYDLKIKAK